AGVGRRFLLIVGFPGLEPRRRQGKRRAAFGPLTPEGARAPASDEALNARCSDRRGLVRGGGARSLTAADHEAVGARVSAAVNERDIRAAVGISGNRDGVAALEGVILPALPAELRERSAFDFPALLRAIRI